MLVHSPLASASRIAEVQAYVRLITSLQTGNGRIGSLAGADLATLKGMFFVHLYGAYEYTVTSVVQETIGVLNGMSVCIKDCIPQLLSLALHPQCQSLASVGRNKTWEKRIALFENARSEISVFIDASVMPTSGRNLWYEELLTIWQAFGLTGEPLSDLSLKPSVQDLVEKRNAIAHGRETPRNVGARYTMLELGQLLSDVDEVCTYFVQSFSNYLRNGDFRS